MRAFTLVAMFAAVAVSQTAEIDALKDERDQLIIFAANNPGNAGVQQALVDAEAKYIKAKADYDNLSVGAELARDAALRDLERDKALAIIFDVVEVYCNGLDLIYGPVKTETTSETTTTPLTPTPRPTPTANTNLVNAQAEAEQAAKDLEIKYDCTSARAFMARIDDFHFGTAQDRQDELFRFKDWVWATSGFSAATTITYCALTAASIALLSF